jgi:2-(1,2-epoxy-1,2-dihydrophenyl)acetyl-CoA isomerase
MSEDTILLAESDSVLTITLNRPDKLNAFTGAMSDALAAALDRARSPAIRAVLLTGAGKGFSAGQDLADPAIARPGADIGAVVEEKWNPLVRAIAALGKPVIAAVNGVAAGASANLALACDIVLAARSAKFIQPFCRLGLIPDGGGTFLLPRLAGMARAKGMALLGEPVSAEQAAAWGLIWTVVDDDKLMSEARALATKLAAEPTFGFALTKRALHASVGNGLDAQLDLERDLQRLAGASDDYTEGVAAFNEKRKPRFTGRPAKG